MSERAPYSRVYWSVMDDPKFDGIRENPKHIGSWCLLLIVADMAHPAPAFAPANVPKSSMTALIDAGLVDPLSGGRFRIHGLDAERGRRSEAGRTAAGARWQTERSTHAMRTHTEPDANPMLDETRREKTRQDEQSIPRASARNGTSRPRPNSVDRNPELREQREAIRARYGNGMDEPTVKAS